MKVIGRARARDLAAQKVEPDAPKDRTGYVELQLKRLTAEERKAPYYAERVEKVKDYRRRQRKGQADPVWGKWSEFEITLPDGETVVCLYDPAYQAQGVNTNTATIEFFGPLTTTGYRYHTMLDCPDPRFGTLVQHMTFTAHRVYEETIGVLKKRPPRESKAAREAAEQRRVVMDDYGDDAEAIARELGLL